MMSMEDGQDVEYQETWMKKKNLQTNSVYDCTVEDVEYIYNKLSI